MHHCATSLAESEDYAASDLIGGTVFTTQTDLDIVPALREAVAAEAAPSISELVRCDEGVVSPCEDGLEGEAHRRGCFAAAEGYHEAARPGELANLSAGHCALSQPPKMAAPSRSTRGRHKWCGERMYVSR